MNNGFQYLSTNDLIDGLTSLMSDVTIDPQRICSICKDTTYESINNICSGRCHYICHEKCLRNWITYKVVTHDAVYCPQCYNIYDESIIKFYFDA